MYIDEENLIYATSGIIPEVLVNYIKNKIEKEIENEK